MVRSHSRPPYQLKCVNVCRNSFPIRRRRGRPPRDNRLSTILLHRRAFIRHGTTAALGLCAATRLKCAQGGRPSLAIARYKMKQPRVDRVRDLRKQVSDYG